MPTAPANEGSDARREPPIRLVRGTPTAGELAALIAVLMRRSRPAAAVEIVAPSAWARSSRPGTVTASGLPTRPGAAGWRRSGLPR